MITLQNRPNYAEEYIQSWYFAILKCWHAINHNFYWVHHLTIQFAMHGNYLQTVPDMLQQKLSCPMIMQEWLSKAGHCTLSYKLPVGDRNWRSLDGSPGNIDFLLYCDICYCRMWNTRRRSFVLQRDLPNYPRNIHFMPTFLS